jgi:hypothetical protein
MDHLSGPGFEVLMDFQIIVAECMQHLPCEQACSNWWGPACECEFIVSMCRMEWAHNQVAKADSIAARDLEVRQSLPEDVAAELDPRDPEVMKNCVTHMRVSSHAFCSHADYFTTSRTGGITVQSISRE